jgi:hypothetical protein
MSTKRQHRAPAPQPTSRASIALLAVATLSAYPACTYGDDGAPRRRGSADPIPPSRSATISGIDADALIDVVPGEGVGLFVEYESGGGWHVFATCDTAITGFGCEWDVIVTPVEGVADLLTEDDLEFEDFLDFWGSGARMITFTTHGVDGMFFDAPAGEPLLVDALLDGIAANRYLYWVGDGGLHRGAPTSLLELEPFDP